MFENPRRGRQARNFTTNVPKILVLKSSSEQIFSRKLPLGETCVFAVLLKNKFKDSSEGLGGDRGVFPVESLVCFAYVAYCVYSLFLWDICVQASNVQGD